MFVGHYFRGKSWAIDHHFQNLTGLFGTLSLVVNYPHFMISYKYAYNRGLRFIMRHWFCLIAVPLFLIATYVIGYLYYDVSLDGSMTILAINSFFYRIGVGANLTIPTIGMAVTSFAMWLMFLTVGWHYSKQVFGCVLVYASFDQYPIALAQKRLLKVNLLGLAWLNYFFNSLTANAYLKSFTKYMPNTQFIELSVAPALVSVLEYGCYASSLGVVYFVFCRNLRRHGKLPSANMLVPWIAYQLWTFPMFRQEEYLLWVVPFFHSLQYLPFAYKMEKSEIVKHHELSAAVISRKVLGLLFVGFLAFELIPNTLDSVLYPAGTYFQGWYFYSCAITFINIHHFFMDSVTWKFSNPEIRENLFRA